LNISVSGLVSISGAIHVSTKPFSSFTVKRWLGLAAPVADAAAEVGLRGRVWGAESGVFVPGKAGAGVEALVCTAAKAMKTASGRSVACLFIGTYNFPERGFRWYLRYRLVGENCIPETLSGRERLSFAPLAASSAGVSLPPPRTHEG
jgi:hypothetical protein